MKFIIHSILIGLILPMVIQSASAQSAPGVPQIVIVAQRLSPETALQHPGSPAVVFTDMKVVLTAEVEGAGPLGFQWYKNGASLDWETNAVLTIDSADISDEGDYSVVVANTGGRTSGEPVHLFVSNVRPSPYLSLEVGSTRLAPDHVEYAESLGDGVQWLPLTPLGTLSGAQFITEIPGNQKRFYRAAGTNALSPRVVSGWGITESIGSVFSIEVLDLSAGPVRWQSLAMVTNTHSPSLFVNSAQTNSSSRHYRSTPVSIPGSRRSGTLLSSVRWILPLDVYNRVSSEQRAGIAALGVWFNDTEHALQFPTNPVPGYWVVIGDQRVATDTNGTFEIDVPVGVTNGYVVASRGSGRAEAEATFRVSELSMTGQVSSPIVIRYERSGDLEMDGPTGLAKQALPRLADVKCGNPAAHIGNSESCCLDYDGYIPTDCKDPTGTDVWHYIGSTCYRLVNAGLCFRERNSHAIGFRVPGLSCYLNHRYRNCQNVDLNVATGFTLSASATTVQCGKTVEISVHNNSAANETEFFIGPFSWRSQGTLLGSRIAANSSVSYTLRHYEAAVPIPFHVENDVIQYRAPKAEEMPPGVTELKIQIQGRAGATVRTVNLTVICGGCDTDSAIIPIPNMVSIPAGTFLMGSPASEAERGTDETQHQVTITRGFCMGKFEVTQAEYAEVVGSNPSFFNGSLLPVETVSWFEATEYCSKLSQRERNVGHLPEGYAYRLPTEAEWEYACRAGTTTAFHSGTSLRSGRANFDGRYEYDSTRGASYNPSGILLGETTPVGSYAPNAWGLYDMHGNLGEWCSDWYDDYPTGRVTDPQGPTSGDIRVLRGGSWSFSGKTCRAAFRYYNYPGYGGYRNGFRVVLAPVQ